MAIYRLSDSMIKRSTGRSAVAASAYRAGEKITNERDGVTHDYERRGGVFDTEIMVPDDAPDWAQDRAALWNAAEQVEKRKDAQVAREVVLSLPHEVGAAARRALVRGFVREQFVDKGMVADVAFHEPHRDGDERNHHAHIMLTTRTLGRDGFGPKERAWNSKDQLLVWRQSWERHLNQSLEKAQAVDRVDHRSLVAQKKEKDQFVAQHQAQPEKQAAYKKQALALSRLPEPKMGAASYMERKGIRTAVGDTVRDIRAHRSAVMEQARDLYRAVREKAKDLREGFNDVIVRAAKTRRENINSLIVQAALRRGQERDRQRKVEQERQQKSRLEALRKKVREVTRSRQGPSR